ncbi:alpha/beta-Hydrolases superfamily protein [Abeliophyllum distichum]|uniref:Alpha/beta-Hydrolases superfamily protein n=1 Tax=Abeliophyllum distichum TaxID=126358 RepID=A0ABD1QVB8_9LAMI
MQSEYVYSHSIVVTTSNIPRFIAPNLLGNGHSVPDIDSLLIIGRNAGGNAVLLYASKYHDIPAVVNVSGRYDLKRSIEERLDKEFLERIEKDGYMDVKTRKGEFNFRVTKESLTERLKTNMHEAYLSIDKRCRLP